MFSFFFKFKLTKNGKTLKFVFYFLKFDILKNLKLLH